jgi:hypothetical protein
MRYGLVDPERRKFAVIDCPTIEDAYARVGLTAGETDHGTVCRLDNGGSIGIVVFQYSFYVEVAKQHYFALGSKLYAGAAVLYQANRYGQTAPYAIANPLAPRWFCNAAEIEEAIREGEITRPQVVMNGNLIWRWPEPRRH